MFKGSDAGLDGVSCSLKNIECCNYICLYACTYQFTHIYIIMKCVYIGLCVYVYVCLCVYVCVCVFVYMHTYIIIIYTCIHT